jgi:hypothetical protein
VSDASSQVITGQAAVLMAQTIAYQVVTRPGCAKFLVSAQAAHQESSGFPADFAIHQAGYVFS